MAGRGKWLYLLLSQVDDPILSPIAFPVEGRVVMTPFRRKATLLTLQQRLRCYGDRVADGTARHI